MTFDELKTLNPEFVAGIKESQIEANAGWKKPPTDFVDTRIFHCPSCKAPGLNTCWGIVRYTCGAAYLSDGENETPCPQEQD